MRSGGHICWFRASWKEKREDDGAGEEGLVIQALDEAGTAEAGIELAGEADGDQDLGAVGNQSLDDAGGRIQDGGDADGIRPEPVRTGLRDGSGDDNGDRVVGGEEVDGADEQGDARLARARTAHQARNFLRQPEDAAVSLDRLEEAARKKGDDERLAHAECTVADVVESAPEVEPSECDAQDGGEQRAAEEKSHDVQSGERQDEDEHVRRDEQGVLPGGGDGRCGSGFAREADDGIDGERGECGRGGDADVRDELVAHGDALGARGGDRRVGDHGQVVAEHRAAHDGADGDCGRNAERFGEAHGDRRDRGDRSAARADRERDEARDEEESRQQQARGNEGLGDEHGGVDGAGPLGDRGESARQDEDEAHDHDVRLAHSVRIRLDALRQRTASAKGNGHRARHKEGNGHLDPIEIPGDKGKAKVEQGENHKGHKGPKARTNLILFFHRANYTKSPPFPSVKIVSRRLFTWTSSNNRQDFDLWSGTFSFGKSIVLGSKGGTVNFNIHPEARFNALANYPFRQRGNVTVHTTFLGGGPHSLKGIDLNESGSDGKTTWMHLTNDAHVVSSARVNLGYRTAGESVGVMDLSCSARLEVTNNLCLGSRNSVPGFNVRNEGQLEIRDQASVYSHDQTYLGHASSSTGRLTLTGEGAFRTGGYIYMGANSNAVGYVEAKDDASLTCGTLFYLASGNESKAFVTLRDRATLNQSENPFYLAYHEDGTEARVEATDDATLSFQDGSFIQMTRGGTARAELVLSGRAKLTGDIVVTNGSSTVGNTLLSLSDDATLSVSSVIGGSPTDGTPVLTFSANGGTIDTTHATDSATPILSGCVATLGAGGLTINVPLRAASIDQAFTAADEATDATITKTGGQALIVKCNSTHPVTHVKEGVLTFASGVTQFGLKLIVDPQASLALADTDTVLEAESIDFTDSLQITLPTDYTLDEAHPVLRLGTPLTEDQFARVAVQGAEKGKAYAFTTNAEGVLCVTVSEATAGSYIWQGGAGDWNIAANWDPAGVPSHNDRATVTAAATLTLDSSASVGTLDVQTANAVSLTGEASLYVMEGGSIGGSLWPSTATPELYLKDVTLDANGSGYHMLLDAYHAKGAPSAKLVLDNANMTVNGLYLGWDNMGGGSDVAKPTLAITNGILNVTWALYSPYTANISPCIRVGAGGILRRNSNTASGGVILRGSLDVRVEDGGRFEVYSPQSLFVGNSSRIPTSGDLVLANGGVLQVHRLLSLSARSDAETAIAFDGGSAAFTLNNGLSAASVPEMTCLRADAGGGELSVAANVTHALAFPLRGAGVFTKTGAGTLVITNDTTVTMNGNNPVYTQQETSFVKIENAGGVRIAEGTLRCAAGTTGEASHFFGEGTLSGAFETLRLDVTPGSTDVLTLTDLTATRIEADFGCSNDNPVEPRTSAVVAKLASDLDFDSFSWRAVNTGKGRSVSFSCSSEGVVTATVNASSLTILIR